jgi:hypothetical protein
MLFLALLLPALFWDKGPETADQLKQAGITQIAVPAAQEAAWKSAPGFTARVADKDSRVKLGVPKVEYRANQAGPTRSPWIDSNGWRIARSPYAKFIYDVQGSAAALAAAEAYAFRADALIQTDAAGLAPLGEMLAFLVKLKTVDLTPVADIGFVDDGSPQAGEVMNLMIRRNLLFRRVTKPDPRLALNVEFGSAKFPKSAAANPSEFAQQIRFELTDEKRSLRIYGSEVVIGRLVSDGKQARVHLLNYAAGSRPLRGLRVRVLGRFPKHEVNVFGIPGATLMDYTVLADATEFTIVELKSLATIDLSR